MDNNLKTKIFLDSGDPQETREALSLLGFLDGQTTNPSLVVKNPKIQNRFASGETMSNDELLEQYRKIILEIKGIIPEGAISIEVYADLDTQSDTMISQAKELNQWIDNPYIKLPTNLPGLEAASVLSTQDVNVNMTLCFSQQQAAAVYAATREAKPGSVFVSPFIGRLDDLGVNGMDLIRNIRDMYAQSNHHVKLLTASVRSFEHFLYALYLEADIITAPFAILEQWAEQSKPLPGKDIPADNFTDMASYLGSSQLASIPFETIDLNLDFHDYNLDHELTTKGIGKFAQDWNSLIKNS